MHIQYALYPRSSVETHSGSGGGGGVGQNTIIFIVLGVVCLFVILIGFYLVGRSRVACNAPPTNASSLHLQHSPITPPPRIQRKRDMSERTRIWRLWRHTGVTVPSNTANLPTSHLSPSSVTVPMPPRIPHARGGWSTSPTESRPSHSRRVTSLSVATSFSHSHITEEALSDLRASAYDLDGDLETEMLHSARDDVWLGHPLAVEDGYRFVVEEGVVAHGNVTPIVECSVELEDDTATRPATQPKGDNYENLDASPGVARGCNDDEGDTNKTKKMAVVSTVTTVGL